MPDSTGDPAAIARLLHETALQAVRDERARVLNEICEFVRNWGGAPPDPTGRRARLAADIAMRFGVAPEAGQ